MDNGKTLLQVVDLKKHFPISSGLFRRSNQWVRAVDGVSFAIRAGETLGLVGESGSGKTTTGRCILRLTEPTSGKIIFDGVDLLGLRPGDMRAMRRHLQIIFQDPYASLDPRMTIGASVEEPLVIHRLGDRAERKRKVRALLEDVGLDPSFVTRFPHEFSGGQRQRVGIARALALQPKFIVADEPVSALDVSIQAQIVNLMQDLQQRYGLTYLFISHGLAVIQHICTRVGVMYLGKLVELAETEVLFEHPLHPYTQVLRSSIPVPDPEAMREKVHPRSDPPSMIAHIPGCQFHPRCPYVMPECRVEEPPLLEVRPGHQVACFLAKPPWPFAKS